ncbi:MAG: hypothetical protein P8N73_07260 [Pseudomonadales bacterium]|jgi:hypothetical protein|nr:hypothetical protein [Pseudomonadales bacterium]
MKLFPMAMTIAALTFSASTMAGGTTQVAQEQNMDSVVKQLTMSCYRNRQGDRLFVGVAETVRFCQNAAKKAVSAASAQKGLELASTLQQQQSERLN